MINNKIQNHTMKLLSLFLIIVLTAGVVTPAFAYPLHNDGDGLSKTVTLAVPQYYIIPSNFDGVGEIKIHVSFDNPKNLFEGMIWDFHNLAYPDDIPKSLDEVYADTYGNS